MELQTTGRIHFRLPKEEDELVAGAGRTTSEPYQPSLPTALVEKYEGLIPAVQLPDDNDGHVVAAALKCNGNLIVTYNLQDFPQEYMESLGLSVADPDTFIADMIDLSPERCCEAFQEMVLTKNKPPYEESDYLGILRSNKLTETADQLEKHLGLAD